MRFLKALGIVFFATFTGLMAEFEPMISAVTFCLCVWWAYKEIQS